MIEMLLPLIQSVAQDLSPGRMVESIVLLGIIWSRLKPHLKKIEDRLGGLETALQSGFKSGENRFASIETRISLLEMKTTQTGAKNA